MGRKSDIEPAGGDGASGLTVADRDRVCKALASSLADSTRRAYLGHWREFQTWCAARGCKSAPAEPGTIAVYLESLAPAASASALKVCRAAIGAVHRACGLSDPAADELVCRTLSGLVRQAVLRRLAAPLTAEALDAIRKTACRRRVGGTVRRRRESEVAAMWRGLFDIALCSVMRNALLRRGEAACLTWGDISFGPDGSGWLEIRRPRVDRKGEGAMLYLAPATVRDLVVIKPENARAGDSVFGLSAASISRRIRNAARVAGLEGRFTGQSPRIGMARDLAAQGVSLAELMQAGRWTSSRIPELCTRNQAAAPAGVARCCAESAGEPAETEADESRTPSGEAAEDPR